VARQLYVYLNRTELKAAPLRALIQPANHCCQHNTHADANERVYPSLMHTSTIRLPLILYVRINSVHAQPRQRGPDEEPTARCQIFSFYLLARPNRIRLAFDGQGRGTRLLARLTKSIARRRKRRARMNRRDVVGVRAAVIASSSRRRLSPRGPLARAVHVCSRCFNAKIGMGAAAAELSLFLSIRYTPCWQWQARSELDRYQRPCSTVENPDAQRA
jgi:hypothetical protein